MRKGSWKFLPIAVAACALIAASPAGWAQQEVSAGYDLFTTDPSTTDLLGIPFAGDAGARPTFDFEAPPDSANMRRAIGDTDTIVHRLQSATVASVPGTAETIPIELVLLRLVSTIEFDLDIPGADPGAVYVTMQKDRDPAGEIRWNFDPPAVPMGQTPPPVPIQETVQPGPRSFGEMTITFLTNGGGTFNSELQIFADLRLGGNDGPIVCGESAGLPPCSDFDAGLTLSSINSAWSRAQQPESIAIRGVNFSLAAPNPSSGVDTSLDFWAGVDPFISETVCVAHGGHPDPGGDPTTHGTCRTKCTTGQIAPDSCRNGRDDDCNGTIDDCAEDLFGPFVTAPGDLTFECPRPVEQLQPNSTGFATATDNCFPPTLPQGNIEFRDFPTDGCGNTFLIDRVWTAMDNCGNAAAMPDLQQIHVVDTTAPDIDCPEEQTILWTDDRTPAALGTATGSDLCGSVDITFSDVSIPGVCLSEDVTRTWLATDECGLDTPCDQLIFVRGPRDSIEDLEALLLGLGLPNGLENALTSILGNAVGNVCRNNATPAGNQLGAFINLVTAQMGGGIPAEDATALIEAATAIIGALSTGGACPEGCGDDTPPPGPPNPPPGPPNPPPGPPNPPPGPPGPPPGPPNPPPGPPNPPPGPPNPPPGPPGPPEPPAPVCPNPDTSPTVVIDGCDTTVPNEVVENGCTIADLIANCAADADSHGDFERCVTALVNDLRAGDRIERRQAGAILSCAGRSNRP